jgi:hypothetical protein
LNATVGCLANQELRVSTSRWWFQQQLWICELHEVGVTLLRRPQPTVVMNISPRKKKTKKKTGSRWWFLGDKIHNDGFFSKKSLWKQPFFVVLSSFLGTTTWKAQLLCQQLDGILPAASSLRHWPQWHDPTNDNEIWATNGVATRLPH